MKNTTRALALLIIAWPAHAATAEKKASPPVLARSDPPAVVSVASSPPAGGAKSIKQASARLTVVPIGGVGSSGAGAGRYMFGPVDPLQVSELKHTFTIRNDSKSTVTIDHMEASCSCTHADLQDDGHGRRVLAPGQKATVDMAVSLAGDHGLVDKFIWLYAPGIDDAVATLEITATVKDTASVSTASLNFGPMAKGTQRTLPLTVTLNARLKRLATIPDLVASTAEVKLVLKSETMVPNAESPMTIVRQYDVVMTPIGNQGVAAGSIHFGPSSLEPASRHFPDIEALEKAHELDIHGRAPVAQPPSSITLDNPGGISAGTAADTLDNVSVKYSGRVTGAVTLDPVMVLIIDAKSGVASTRHFRVTAADQATLDHLVFSSPNPNVSVRAIPLAEVPPVPSAINGSLASAAPDPRISDHGVLTAGVTGDYEVKILPDSAGQLQAILTVTAADGESTLFPVVAKVSP